jgi:5-methylcytosine-specific restriction endonuclease McrA
MAKRCKYCDSLDHTQFYCRLKPRAVIKAKKSPAKVGKYGKQWLITRASWFERNPADHYICYLQISPYCLRTMKLKETTLDHIQSRTRHPELRFDLDNLAPCCGPCNELKGSKSLEEVKEQYNG